MNDDTPELGSGKPREVLDAVAEMIVARGIGVGDRLPPEIELARELGVGRSTVREALRSWQSMGIVTRNKGAGTVLRAPISAQSMQFPLSISLEAQSLMRTLEVRRPLEVDSARLAAVRADERQRHEIMTRMYELMDALDSGADWRPQDHAFHAAIHEATGNPLYKQLVDQLQHAFHAVYEAPFGEPQLGTDSIPLHRPLAEAIRDGDPDGAARIMNDILDLVEKATQSKIGDTDA
ncbi:FadR/GntR family transcriptional regulator [Psychromarinibacter halotolerans]|uniref:FadR/GntR family transcriptional regulator n=1 Tax=Psychromarinibacter halotolerans TaxID=1775175 RepID=A0ABV7GZD8_9RHOB|nr:FadR/GntR family transcriptional regulator [Psychromarinibacter halotolerans]MAQ82213.1 GntR family transcriptional regulator [Maritimibacter sp.]MDF0596078.1 FadR/GntR family transcriptional regulator [Psychromarinibacter halotolerans]